MQTLIKPESNFTPLELGQDLFAMTGRALQKTTVAGTPAVQFTLLDRVTQALRHMDPALRMFVLGALGKLLMRYIPIRFSDSLHQRVRYADRQDIAYDLNGISAEDIADVGYYLARRRLERDGITSAAVNIASNVANAVVPGAGFASDLVSSLFGGLFGSGPSAGETLQSELDPSVAQALQALNGGQALDWQRLATEGVPEVAAPGGGLRASPQVGFVTGNAAQVSSNESAGVIADYRKLAPGFGYPKPELVLAAIVNHFLPGEGVKSLLNWGYQEATGAFGSQGGYATGIAGVDPRNVDENTYRMMLANEVTQLQAQNPGQRTADQWARWILGTQRYARWADDGSRIPRVAVLPPGVLLQPGYWYMKYNDSYRADDWAGNWRLLSDMNMSARRVPYYHGSMSDASGVFRPVTQRGSIDVSDRAYEQLTMHTGMPELYGLLRDFIAPIKWHGDGDASRGVRLLDQATLAPSPLIGCDACYDHAFWRRDTFTPGIFFNSSWFTGRLEPMGDNDAGYIDVSSRPFEIVINSNYAVPRAQVAFAHEALHALNELQKLNLSHEQVHNTAIMLASEVLPGMMALNRKAGNDQSTHP